MADKISQKELDYLKKTMSPEQIVKLASLKSRIDSRKRKLGKNAL